MWTIYAHISPDGKAYVGRTTKTLRERSGLKGQRYRPNQRFWNDIQKFGWNNFKHKILATCESEEDSMRLEIQYIAEYESTDENKGYNRSVGGYPCNKGYTEEERKRLAALCSKKWKDEHPEQARNIRRKYDRSQKRHDWANAWNKTEKRRKHRTEYMRTYRELHRETLREQARIRRLRKKVAEVDIA